MFLPNQSNNKTGVRI